MWQRLRAWLQGLWAPPPEAADPVLAQLDALTELVSARLAASDARMRRLEARLPPEGPPHEP